MKRSLADRIEQYIKVLIARSEDKRIEIQRAELAETFDCVPSQVTYVIATRFTQKEGYCTESRRGGRGYVRITEYNPEYLALLLDDSYLFELIDELLAQHRITEREAQIIKYLSLHVGKEIPVEYHMKLNEGFISALRQLIPEA